MERVKIDLSDIPGIPAEALEALSQVPLDPYDSRRAHWEAWEDEALMRLWRAAGSKASVAKALGKSETTCRKRYVELIEEANHA